MDSKEVATSQQQRQLGDTPRPGAMISPSERLAPASEKQGRAELLSCLTLVAPTGMSGDERNEWLRVAKMTLTGIPADLLARGCKLARETADHPSKIVKIIMSEAKEPWAKRRRDAAIEAAQHANRHAPRLTQQEPDYVDAAKISDLIKRLPSSDLNNLD